MDCFKQCAFLPLHMRNFIAFFKRFRIFILFLVLQIIALSTYISYLQYPRSQYLTTANGVSASILEKQKIFTKYINLPKNNIALQRENILLRRQILQSNYKIERGKISINDTAYEQQYTYIPATLLNSTVSRMNNYFTIDVGKAQGVYKGLGVFSDKGVVGVIHQSSEHYSIVKSVLTKDINIDILIEPVGLFGLLKWDGRSPRYGSLIGISNDINIKKWSTVVTRGGSGIFPKGIPVGKVARVEPIEGEPLWDVRVLFAENFRTLQQVYVIKNLFRKELEEIERTIPNDDDE